MEPSNEVKVIRAPSLKRGKNDERLSERIKLKKVIGLTVCSNAGLDVSLTNGVLAYPAGCTVVLFNPRKVSQSYLQNSARKAITAVAYSHCGRYLATGECGINPTIKVWELEPSNGNCENYSGGSIVAEFSGHKYAVSCVAFSPTGKYLVSVGSQHDNIVNVFDWKANTKIASNKVSAKVVAVSFSIDGNYFVTVGNRHVKFWYLEGGRRIKEPVPLMGRSAILGELRNNDFTAVACGKGDMADSTYAITRQGHLVEFNARRLLDKWVMCRTASANCIVTSAKYIFVGCGDAIVRCFNAETLEYITTLPRTHFLGVDVAQGVHINHMMAAPPNAKYPDCIAIVYDEARSKVSCIYNDHSLYIWDLRDVRRVGKSHSFLYHSACIWGVETVPFNYTKNNIPINLPSDCFLTCSSDDTIRVWGIDDCETNEQYRKNIYSKDLLKVFYIDDELNFIKDMDNPILSTEKNLSYDGRNGVRCVKVNPSNGHLATGDRSGNIRIYNFNTLKLLSTIEAHDSEVLCLEYTNEKIKRKLLASASRDRLIHIFDVEQDYKILQTLDDHSSSITSVRFVGGGSEFSMISCGADKSIIFRSFQHNFFARGNNSAGKATLYDMEVDSNSKHILTACQDRNIRVYSTQTAKQTKTFKGSHSEEGSLIKLCLDLSGIYIATSCTDKTLSVYDYYSNECMARMSGHSELVTGLKFTNDCKHLISASGDGCVFVWQVPHDMIVTMQARMSQQAMRMGHPPVIPRPMNSNFIENEVGSPPNTGMYMQEIQASTNYRFSEVGQLPQWAKRKTTEEQSQSPLGTSPVQTQKPRGRWAQRGQFDAETLDLRSIVESPFGPERQAERFSTNQINNNTPTSGYNSAGSKDVYGNAYLSEDSSIDSGRENRRQSLKQEIPNQKMHSLNSESNTEHDDHDGDIEDMSDGERTNSDHGLIYYPSGGHATPTDFKVNEMDMTELRKSIRKQKAERQGLTLSTLSLAQATSDDEDEASTPSAENGERSLASTFGGSTDNIPQDNTFLQAALDGPGRGNHEKSRKSLSSMHSTDGKISTSISKSFANSKKEELMKVINDAKQKLQKTGEFRITITNTSSMYDRMKVGYRSNLRASQSISDLSHQYRSSQSPGPCTPKPQHYNYLNCAAPKAKISQNCNMIKQFQNNLPPYPLDVGIYGTKSKSERPLVETMPNFLLPAEKLKKHPSILKHYKSCPVSPVSEELEWSSLAVHNTTATNDAKRHSMFGNDAKHLFNMIHSDTEKMIAEITQKYGDLEEFDPKGKVLIPAKDDDDDANFSSDSLEDCSLNADSNKRCHKHFPRPPPRRSVSDYHIFQDSNQYQYNPYRNVSLSDILNETDEREQNFLSTLRHSSASFFLGQPGTKKSQESLLSEEFSGGGASIGNSMESILSDDSECRSAPLEILFEKCEFSRNYHNEPFKALEMPASKSYGSSPNAVSNFDFYMQQQEQLESNLANYGLDVLRIPPSITYPSLSTTSTKIGGFDDEDIPNLNNKLAQYNAGINKSLSKDFATQRKSFNTNPIYQSCKRPTMVPTPFTRADIFNSGAENRIKKSCSFEMDFGPTAKIQSDKKFAQNLQRFEKDILAEHYKKSSTLETDYLAHKPPVANKRSSSVKSRKRLKAKDRFSTGNKGDYGESFVVLDHIVPQQAEEIKSFELYVAEKECDNDNNMDSLEFQFTKKNIANSVDSLDSLPVRDEPLRFSAFTDSPEYTKFRDIEKKLEIINKLVSLEEKHLEHVRQMKEISMKPFVCDASSKGYVKNLTKNFDNLSKSSYECGATRMKRNHSLPDVLEGTKLSIHEDTGDNCDFYGDEQEKEMETTTKGMISHHFLSSNDSDDSSIRRACSLSDLTMGKLGIKPSNKTTSTPSRTNEKRNLPKRSNSSVGRSATSGMGLRSVSTGMLCQASDSEPDQNQPRGGLMRQTISSTNKQNVTQKYINPRSAAGIISRRKGMQNSYSSVNLSTTAQDGSSSEESSPPNNHNNNNNRIDTTPSSNKPQVPPRPRNISGDKRTVITLTAIKKEENVDAPCKDSDPECDMTSQICSNLINQLMQTTSSVIQLHQRLKTSDEGQVVTNGGGGSRNNTLMLKELENAVIMTQNMLTKITNNRNNSSSGESGIYTSYITNSHDRATINITPTNNSHQQQQQQQQQHTTNSSNSVPASNGDFNQLMDKCSDLLSKVQRHVNS